MPTIIGKLAVIQNTKVDSPNLLFSNSIGELTLIHMPTEHVKVRVIFLAICLSFLARIARNFE